jgi:cytochrome c-type protein NapB
MPTTPYWALRDRRAGPSRTVTSDLAALRTGLPSPADPVIPVPGDRARAVAARAERRAFDGAPPWVPHPVDEQSSAACLACHGAGMQVAKRTAPVMSHEPRSQCLQCHVPTVARWPGAEEPAVPTTFAGLPSAGPGPRAWAGAPPIVPHGTFMREDCASCHGVAGLPGLRTTHPARKNCTQCHVPAESPQPFARGS